MMSLPLEGYRILDATHAMHGPYATAMLADMGADVIKVEDFPRGEMTRRHPQYGSWPRSPINYLIELQSRNKRSLAVNLRDPQGTEVVYRLAKRCDVFASNLRMRTLQKWRLNYERLSEHNPKIIYAIASGWGPRGPVKDAPGDDLAAQARSGILWLLTDPDCEPAWGVHGSADTIGSLQFAYGIALALLAKERLGIGQEVHTSILGGQITMGATVLSGTLVSGQDYHRRSRKTNLNPLRNTYPTKDGRWISLGITRGERYWEQFCRMIGQEYLATVPAFSTMEGREANCLQMVAILDDIFRSKTLAEWSEILSSFDFIWGPVQTHAEVAKDPQVLENEYITTFDHPEHGSIPVIGIPVQLSKTPGSIRTAAPQFGQHTEDILKEIGGYNWEEITELKKAGVII